MNWLVYHIASGQVFFTGVVLQVVGIGIASRAGAVAGRVAALLVIVGVVAVAISSTPIPYWYYATALALTAGWVIARRMKIRSRVAPVAAIAIWIGAACIELPYHFTPTLNTTGSRCVAIIGDSVTAGMGRDDRAVRWPEVFAKEHDVAVQDLSRMGETARSALRQWETQEVGCPLVVVEIGGNDLLGSTTMSEFAQDLDALLSQVAVAGRQVVMFELPLPPFRNGYGRVQRELSRKHHVALVPKRVFMSILADEECTVDTIHLSQTGHERMAGCVWDVLESALPQND